MFALAALALPPPGEAAWHELSGELSPDAPFTGQSAAVIGGAPHVAYAEYASGTAQVRVKRWNGSAWVALGGALNANAAAHIFVRG